MDEGNYKLRYLPLFYEDLSETLDYINNERGNPQAAEHLLDLVEKAILERVPAAESFEPFHSLGERKYPYYRIYVKNYVIYYVVIHDEGQDKIMEIRRFLYKGRDRERLL